MAHAQPESQGWAPEGRVYPESGLCQDPQLFVLFLLDCPPEAMLFSFPLFGEEHKFSSEQRHAVTVRMRVGDLVLVGGEPCRTAGGRPLRCGLRDAGRVARLPRERSDLALNGEQ